MALLAMEYGRLVLRVWQTELDKIVVKFQQNRLPLQKNLSKPSWHYIGKGWLRATREGSQGGEFYHGKALVGSGKQGTCVLLNRSGHASLRRCLPFLERQPQ